MAKRAFKTVFIFLVVGIAIVVTRSAFADNLIVPGRRIGPIQLGMTPTELYRAAGSPVSQSTPCDTNAGCNYFFFAPMGQPNLVAHVVAGRVEEITTSMPSYATAEGIKVGLAPLALEANWGPAQKVIDKAPGYPAAMKYYQACYASRGIYLNYSNSIIVIFVSRPHPNCP
jgi:hypothetical protein